MAVADSRTGALTLKVLYCGAAGAGKTTNLQRVSTLIHGSAAGRITPRLAGENRIASLEFPAGPLGLLLGGNVIVRLETLQGEVADSGRAWSAALADADGIVFVADSSPQARIANVRALAAIRERTEARGRSVAPIPVVMQWNKRDCADARSVAELEAELNHRCFPSMTASALRDTGAVETLFAILKRTIHAAQRRAGGSPLAEEELGRIVESTIEKLAQSAREDANERFGMTIERHANEVVFSAESLGRESSEVRMLAALESATMILKEQNASGLPPGLMAGLLAGCDRTQGSLLLSQETPPLEDPETELLRTELVVPLSLGSVAFGRMVVRIATGEHPPTAAERAYWRTAATLASVFLAWQAEASRTVETRRRRFAPGLDSIEPRDS